MKPTTRSAVGLTVLWLLTRVVVILTLHHGETSVLSDVSYYYESATSQPIAWSLVEYPTPVAVVCTFLASLQPDRDGFQVAFAAVLAVVDLAVVIVCWGRGRVRAGAYWTVFTALLGPLIYTRLDLFTAIPVFVALIYAAAAPRLSGAAIAVGAATKLWPAMLIAPMVGRDPGGRRRLVGFLGVGALLGCGSLALFGWQRSVSPMTWQSDRGLQIESIAATVPMLARLQNPGSAKVFYSDHNAVEIAGPWTASGLVLTDILFAVTIVAGLVIAIAALRRSMDSFGICCAVLFLTAGIILSNKTLSPQYLTWLAGPIAIVLDAARDTSRRLVTVVACLGLVCAALTHIIYPIGYTDLSEITPNTAWMTGVLVARNLLIVAITALAGALTVNHVVRPAFRREPNTPTHIAAISDRATESD